MFDQDTSCHGTLECLHGSSHSRVLGRVAKIYQKPRSYVVWWLENLGWRASLKQALVRPLMARTSFGDPQRRAGAKAGHSTGEEILGLQPGELVEVRCIEEILATLDNRRRHKGLLWMTGMRKYCGTRCRVYKRVGRIMLESDGQLRTMKNTVLLEGAACDGREFGGCDRSCFHFWREIWLKRVSE